MFEPILGLAAAVFLGIYLVLTLIRRNASNSSFGRYIMSINGWLQIALLLLLAFILIKPLGAYMARVFEGERTFLAPVLGPIEKLIYLIAGINPKREQGWLAYTLAMLAFNLIGFVTLYAILRLQFYLPLNRRAFRA